MAGKESSLKWINNFLANIIYHVEIISYEVSCKGVESEGSISRLFITLSSNATNMLKYARLSGVTMPNKLKRLRELRAAFSSDSENSWIAQRIVKEKHHKSSFFRCSKILHKMWKNFFFAAGFIFSLFSLSINFETPTIIPVASTTRMLIAVSSTHARFSVWHDFAWIYSHLFSTSSSSHITYS